MHMKTSSLSLDRSAVRGFTLVEILIVVAIIGILASVALVGLGPVQRSGRDARRISDLRQTQGAIEIYYNKCGYYPGSVQMDSTCNAFQTINTWAALTDTLTGSKIGVTKIPNDPTAGRSYSYGVASDGSSYVIGARLENLNNNALNDDIDGTVQGVDCGSGGSGSDNLYCVSL